MDKRNIHREFVLLPMLPSIKGIIATWSLEFLQPYYLHVCVIPSPSVGADFVSYF